MLLPKRNELQVYSWVHAGNRTTVKLLGNPGTCQLIRCDLPDRTFVGWAIKQACLTASIRQAGDTRLFDGLT